MTRMEFTPDMTVSAALAAHPKVRWVLAAWQLRHCATCSTSEVETLAEVAEGYKLPLEQLLRDLNSIA